MKSKKHQFRDKTKKVIDADNQIILEYFDPVDTRQIKAKYKALNKWNDISIDKTGDIILWEDE